MFIFNFLLTENILFYGHYFNEWTIIGENGYLLMTNDYEQSMSGIFFIIIIILRYLKSKKFLPPKNYQLI